MFGLFSKKKKPPADEPPSESVPGWDAIEAAFSHLYPGQKPKHWAHDGVMRMHDINNPPENPLDGVSIYDGGRFWHYVSFGLSDLYAKGSPGEWSGFGYEFTFRVAKTDPEPPTWPIDVMNSLARAEFKGANFGAGHAAKTGPITGDAECRLTALLMVDDPSFEVQETPHGKLAFLLLLGVEGQIREKALANGVSEVVAEEKVLNADLITRA